MQPRGGPSTLDSRAHFRILVATSPSVSCLPHGLAKTPSRIDGVFCVNEADTAEVAHV